MPQSPTAGPSISVRLTKTDHPLLYGFLICFYCQGHTNNFFKHTVQTENEGPFEHARVCSAAKCPYLNPPNPVEVSTGLTEKSKTFTKRLAKKQLNKNNEALLNWTQSDAVPSALIAQNERKTCKENKNNLCQAQHAAIGDVRASRQHIIRQKRGSCRKALCSALDNHGNWMWATYVTQPSYYQRFFLLAEVMWPSLS